MNPRRALLALLLALPAARLAAAEDPFASVRFTAPAGWQIEKDSAAKEPELRFTQVSDIIMIRLRGGQGSRSASQADFVAGFEATTMGRLPEKLRRVKVAGRRVWLYRHGYPIMLGDPHVSDPRPPQLAREEFCMLPYGEKFLVLSWAHESPVPDPEEAGKRAWEAFLDSFTVTAP